MTSISIGDLARTFQLRRYSTTLKSDLNRLGAELTTGQKSDLGASLAGDFGPLAGIERSLRTIAAYKTANTETAGLLAAAQSALEATQNMGEELTSGLLTAASARDSTLINATSQDARQKFSAVVSVLNTRVADRSLFAGAATDQPALATGDAMMEEIKLAIAGETTASGIVAAVDAWFDTPGGGFETTGYLGSTQDMGPLMIADGDKVQMSLRADDTVIRETLKGFALAGLVAEGALSGDIEAQAELVSTAAERMLTSDGDLTNMRARIGTIEARIENAQARNASEASAYELARAELVSADPYETATRLEAVYSQIETLYTVTARIANLSFADYMS